MTLLFTLTGSDFFSQFGMMLIHSLWQLLLLALLFRVFLAVTNERQARARYLAAMLTLTASICIPAVTFCKLSQANIDQTVYAGTSNPQSEAGVQHSSAGLSPKANEQELSGPPETSVPPGRVVIPQMPVPPESASAGKDPAWFTGWSALPGRWAPWLACFWLVGVLISSLRPAFGLVQVFRMKYVGLSSIDQKIERRLQEFAERLKIRRRVAIAQSTLVRVPTLIGFFRPVILIPASTISGLSVPQLEAVLVHELGHLKRWDDLLLLFQSVVETLFFYHPAVWWVSGIAGRERENCCDDLATRTVGSTAPLASALLILARNNSQPANVLAATGGHLSARIRRLTQANIAACDTRSHGFRNLFSVGVVIAIGVACGSILANAGESAASFSRAEILSVPEPQGVASVAALDNPDGLETRTEIVKKLRSASDEQLQATIVELLGSESFGNSQWYEPCLMEAVSRGGEKWERFLVEQLEKLNATTFVPNPQTPQHRQPGKNLNVELLTALRRVQERPDPLEIVVEPFEKTGITPISLPRIQVAIRNRDEQAVGIQFGGNYRSGRQPRWRVAMVNRDGTFREKIIDWPGMGGGLSTRRMLQPGEVWKTELILEHLLEVDRPDQFQMEVLYSNNEVILTLPDLEGLVVYRSSPIEIDIQPIQVDTSVEESSLVDRLIDEIDPEELPHVLQGDYGRWAYDFLPPETPQARLLQIGLPAIPGLVAKLNQSTSPQQRAHCLATLYSITGQKNPRYARVLSDYRYLIDGWGMKNSVQVQQHSGRAYGGGMDSGVQQELAREWQRWCDQVIRTDRQTGVERSESTETGNAQQDEGRQEMNLTAHPEYRKFQTGEFVVTGRIVNYESLGRASAGQADARPMFFHRFEFTLGGQIHGDYLGRVEQARQSAGLPKRPTVTALLLSSRATLDDSLTAGNAEAILVMESMKAGAMAGTVPVRLSHVTSATPELIAVARHACSAPELTQPVPGQAHLRIIRITIEGETVDAVVSPDQRRVVFGRRGPRSKEIFIANRDGSEVTQLTDNRFVDYSPDWSADGSRIVFCSTRTGVHQIFTMDLKGRGVEQLTDARHGARKPRISADGWMAWLAMGERSGKSHPSDLVVKKGDQKIVVIRNVDIMDYSWSHDGQSICIGTVNTLGFYNMATQALTSVNVYEKDRRLYAHGPYEITWNADNDRVACRIAFLGGRGVSSGDSEDSYIYGDREVFIVSKSGDMEVMNRSDISNSDRDWIKARFVDR